MRPDFIFCKEDLRYEQELYQRWVQLHPQYVHQVLRDQCAHHCQDMDNCGLSSIQVGTHENHPSMDQCTDCQSFRKI